MQQVVLKIRNAEKAKFLLDFLRQLDFVEIGTDAEDSKNRGRVHDQPAASGDEDDFLLNAPVLSSDEIDNIERIGKEFGNWKISEF